MNYLDELRRIAAQSEIDELTLNTDTCWFCGKPGAEKRYAEEVYLYRNYSTEFGLTSHRSQWEQLKRGIPCCQKCNTTHYKSKRFGVGLAWLGGISGFIGGLILPFFIVLKLNIDPGKDFNGIVPLSIFGGLIAGAILGYLAGKKLAFRLSPETKPLKFAIEHPVVSSLIEQGWKFGNPKE